MLIIQLTNIFMNKPKIHVILGSIREGRAGVNVAKWFMEAMKDYKDAELELVDLKDYPLPLFDDAVLPGMRQGLHKNPAVQKWLDKVNSADGYIIITPEYNHGYPSALKNALDFPYKEWGNKAVGFVSYGGGAGGGRAVEQLRQVAGELHLYDVRDQVLIPMIWSAFDKDGKLLNADIHIKTALAVTDAVTKLSVQLKK